MNEYHRKFRLVMFIRNPFFPERSIVAAIYGDEYQFRIVERKRCNCRPEENLQIRLALDDLANSNSIHELPAGMGPHFVLGEHIYSVPELVRDGKAWLQEML